MKVPLPDLDDNILQSDTPLQVPMTNASRIPTRLFSPCRARAPTLLRALPTTTIPLAKNPVAGSALFWAPTPPAPCVYPAAACTPSPHHARLELPQLIELALGTPVAAAAIPPGGPARGTRAAVCTPIARRFRSCDAAAESSRYPWSERCSGPERGTTEKGNQSRGPSACSRVSLRAGRLCVCLLHARPWNYQRHGRSEIASSSNDEHEPGAREARWTSRSRTSYMAWRSPRRWRWTLPSFLLDSRTLRFRHTAVLAHPRRHQQLWTHLCHVAECAQLSSPLAAPPPLKLKTVTVHLCMSSDALALLSMPSSMPRAASPSPRWLGIQSTRQERGIHATIFLDEGEWLLLGTQHRRWSRGEEGTGDIAPNPVSSLSQVLSRVACPSAVLSGARAHPGQGGWKATSEAWTAFRHAAWHALYGGDHINTRGHALVCLFNHRH